MSRLAVTPPSRRHSHSAQTLWITAGLLGTAVCLPTGVVAQSADTSGVSVQLAQTDDFGSGAQSGVTLQRPLLGQGAPGQSVRPGETVRSVVVKGIGSSSDEAQRDAARQAVQQVAGLYIDARRQVESKITDKAVADIVHEQILSYSNAYITKLEVKSVAKQPDGLLVVEAQVSVAVAPLIKVLQDNKVPTVAFDTATAVGQVDVAAGEKQSAIDIYADLIKRSADLITVSLGTPKVDTSLPAPVDKSWLTIPVTYIANDQAVRDWRAKFEGIAAARMTMEMPVRHAQLYAGGQGTHEPSCTAPVFDAQNALNRNDLEQGFLGTADTVPRDQPGITACFVQENGSSSAPADCFGRIFPTGALPSSNVCQGPDCLSLYGSARKLGMHFELVDGSGSIVESVPVHFNSFPMINVGGSAAVPPSGASGFFNFCVPKQSPFFFLIPLGFTAYGGTVLVLPPPGTRLYAYANFLLPNDVIARTASLRVRIVQN